MDPGDHLPQGQFPVLLGAQRLFNPQSPGHLQQGKNSAHRGALRERDVAHRG